MENFSPVQYYTGQALGGLVNNLELTPEEVATRAARVGISVAKAIDEEAKHEMTRDQIKHYEAERESTREQIAWVKAGKAAFMEGATALVSIDDMPQANLMDPKQKPLIIIELTSYGVEMQQNIETLQSTLPEFQEK